MQTVVVYDQGSQLAREQSVTKTRMLITEASASFLCFHLAPDGTFVLPLPVFLMK